MVNYAQLRDLDTSKLTSAAEESGAFSGDISSRGGEVDGAANIPAGTWQGDDATAASNLLRPLSAPLYDVSDSASVSQGVITELVGELDKAKTKLDDAHDLIGGTGITIGADGTVTTPVVDNADEAANNDRIAKQIRDIIDEAVRMANTADDTAVGALASVGGFLAKMLGPALGKPLGDGPNWALWGAGQGLGRFGNLASYMEKAGLGRFAPRGPDGRFISPKNMSAWQKALAGSGVPLLNKNSPFVSKPGTAPARAAWGTAAKWAGRAGGLLTGITSGANQWATDSAADPNMGGWEQSTRAGYRGLVEGGAAFGGGWAGAAAGAAIGTAIFPGVGTVVGGLIGGIAGGVGGQQLGKLGVDNSIDAVGNAGEAVGNWAGDTWNDITPW